MMSNPPYVDTMLPCREGLCAMGFAIFIAILFILACIGFFTTKKKRDKILLFISACLGLICLVLVAFVPERQVDPEKIKSDYKKFEQSILKIATQITDNELKFRQFEETFMKNPVVSVESYDYVKQYKDVIQSSIDQVQALEVSDDIPDEAKELMTEGKSKILDGLFLKMSALDSLMKYMDSQEVSDLSKFKEYSPVLLPAVQNGMKKIDEARQKLEIEQEASN